MQYSAYVPCFNNAATIRAAVEGIGSQTVPPAELLVVDDGSIDDSPARLRGLPVRIVRHDANLGRGAARARAMMETRHEFVLCCDATNVVAADFAACALRWFDDPAIGAVFGRINQRERDNAVSRWRARHLFKIGVSRAEMPGAVDGGRFATWGAMVRRSALLAVGNYDARLRQAEDADVGRRLDAAGWRVVYDTRLAVFSIAENSLGQVLERYWRWNAGRDCRVTWTGYLKNIRYSLGVAGRDLVSGAPAVAAISLLCPHYCFWRSRHWMRRHAASDG
ncbi:MAG TPA: glycosyltransferase family 2 protein [Opitutaceae bacterium]|nr:glycosyltransferase family 2 protein [Opitutaceae bacterium]